MPPHPRRDRLEVGDFIWPRKIGLYVPFNTSGLAEREEEEEEWGKQRDRFVEAYKGSKDPDLRRAAEQLSRMSFGEFYSLYTLNQPSGGIHNFSSSDGRFGHVGIVARDSGGRQGVLEAMPEGATGMGAPVAKGVRFVPYDRWIEAQSESLVWAGRLRGYDAPKRALVADVARQFIGKDYWLWNLDLGDEAHFYCSKLCWLSIWKALKFAVDGENELKRSFWFTPKRFINLNSVDVYHAPEPY